MSNKLLTNVFIFKHTENEDAFLKGTWTRATKKEGKTAIVNCPDCSNMLSLSKHEIRKDGLVAPSLVCPYSDYNFHEYIILENWEINE